MILAYTRDAAGAVDNFRIMNLFAMSYILNTEDYLTSEVCFLCKAKVSSEEKDKGV